MKWKNGDKRYCPICEKFFKYCEHSQSQILQAVDEFEATDDVENKYKREFMNMLKRASKSDRKFYMRCF